MRTFSGVVGSLNRLFDRIRNKGKARRFGGSAPTDPAREPWCGMESLEPRLLLSAAYEVWAGNTDPTAGDWGDFWLNVDEQDYTQLGEGSTDDVFNGDYDWYVIAARRPILVDAVQGSTGSYIPGGGYFVNSDMLENIWDAPDGADRKSVV